MEKYKTKDELRKEERKKKRRREEKKVKVKKIRRGKNAFYRSELQQYLNVLVDSFCGLRDDVQQCFDDILIELLEQIP